LRQLRRVHRTGCVARDPGFGVGLSRIEAGPLLFRLPPLECDDVGLALEARGLFVGPRELRFEGDDRFLLLVLLFLHRGDGDGRLRDGELQVRGFSREPAQRVALEAHALAQLLDLAPRRQNAA
jgi:hypothetical protein